MGPSQTERTDERGSTESSDLPDGNIRDNDHPAPDSTASAEPVPAPRAELRVFGEAPCPAQLTVFVRSRAWRLRGTVLRIAGTAVAAPVAFLLPPHAPWGVGALLGGILFARRRWTERYTSESFSGSCPRCGTELVLSSGTRLLDPHPLSCEGCHHEVLLHIGLEPVTGGSAT